MSAPRKGKDISALKARLAKRANPGSAPGPGGPGAPAPQPAAPPVAQRSAPPPVEDSFGDLEQTRPASPHHHVQAGARPAAPPSPGPAAPASPSAPSAAASTGASPFGGGASFDPDEGLIGGGTGEFKPKSGIGLLAAGVLLGMGGGALLGWVANVSMSKGDRVKIATSKATKMLAEIDQVSKSRKSLSMEWSGIKTKLATQPAAGVKALRDVMTNHFGKGYAREDQLFGWQLGSMGKTTVDSTFSFYRAAKNLKSDLNALARFTQNEGKLMAGSPPSAYALLVRDGQGQLVELVNMLCGADMQSAKPCPPRARKKPVGAAVRLAPGQEPKNLPMDKLAILTPRGPYYSAAIASDPKSNVMRTLQQLTARVDKDLEAMAGAEAQTTQGFKAYKDNPTVNADGPQ